MACYSLPLTLCSNPKVDDKLVGWDYNRERFWSCELVFWCYRWFWSQNLLFSSQMGSNVPGSGVEVAQKQQWTPTIYEENIFHFVEQPSFESHYPTGGQIEVRVGVYLMFYSKMWITYNTNSVSLKHQFQTPINWCSAWWAAETKKKLWLSVSRSLFVYSEMIV